MHLILPQGGGGGENNEGELRGEGNGERILTVGKLFSGFTILENWRNYRASMKRRRSSSTDETNCHE